MEYKYIAIYCKIHHHSDKTNNTIVNILSKARELFNRLLASYTNHDIKIMIFGIDDKNKAYEYLPKEMIEFYECNNINDMNKQIWKIIKDNKFESRVYLVLTNWQWRYIEPLLRLKHEKYKFFYEGVLDARSIEEIKREKRYEKIAKVEVKQGLLGLFDAVGGKVSTDLKG